MEKPNIRRFVPPKPSPQARRKPPAVTISDDEVRNFRRELEAHDYLEEDLDNLFWEANETRRSITPRQLDRIFNVCHVDDDSWLRSADIKALWTAYQRALENQSFNWDRMDFEVLDVGEDVPAKNRRRRRKRQPFTIRTRGES